MLSSPILGLTLHFNTYSKPYRQLVSYGDDNSFSTAASLEPNDPEIAFNLAAVLEACEWENTAGLDWLENRVTGGKLEEALEQYKISKKYGVEKADMHIRNVS